MFRLSVVVPAVGCQDSVEESLVSLLTNRPHSCEVIVVCQDDYDDPYGLSDEVRFVRVTDRSPSWVTLANVGVRTAQGAYVNLVLPGVSVLEGWDAPAIDRLQRTARMGSIAPFMFDERDEQSDQAVIGLTYQAARPRRLRCVPISGREQDLPVRVVGPTSHCGFFRRQDLFELGGWDERLPNQFADVDLALRLRRRGLASVCDPGSCVVLREDLDESGSSTAAELREAEQLFWSHAGQVGPRAWLGYAVSWLNPTTAPVRLGGVFRSRSSWTDEDFNAATERHLPSTTRRAA